MKQFAAVVVLCTVATGCSKSPNRAPAISRPATPARTTAGAPGESPKVDVSSPQAVPPQTTSSEDAGTSYPEKNEVLAILYRARELRQKSQFQAALELVSQAQVVDPHSPSAQTKEQEIAEILKRLQTPKNREHRGSTSRAA